jgi:hypothetical protein
MRFGGIYRNFSGASVKMKAVITTETSQRFYQTTRRNNPEKSHLHTLSHENLKSQNFKAS